MTSDTITPEQRLTVVKHLAGGKNIDVTATITHLPTDIITEVAKSHGYPDRGKLAWAVDVLTKKADEAHAIPAGGKAHVDAVRADQQPRPVPSSTPTQGLPAARPDEIRILLDTAKGHPSKRIQTAADRIFDNLDKLRALLREDQEKHAAKRQADAEKTAVKAEVAKLEQQLAAAKAKLRGGPASTPAAVVRRWAAANDVACAATGTVPTDVRQAYADAHRSEAS